MPTGMLFTDGGKTAFDTTAGSSGGSYLIPKTLYSELLDDVKKNLVLRALAAKVIGPDSIRGPSIVMSLRTKNSLDIAQVGEGAEFPLDVEHYSSLTITPKKYGVRIGVTKEMMEDGNWDGMALNVQTAAFEIADNEESLIITELDTASGLTGGTRIANSNATLPITDITSAMMGLEEEYHQPTDMIVGVEVAQDMRNIKEFNSREFGNNSLGQRLVGNLWGMNVIVSNNVSAKYAYIIDRRYAFIIAEKRPVTIEKYADVARDAMFSVVSQRIAVSYYRPGAVARIITT